MQLLVCSYWRRLMTKKRFEQAQFIEQQNKKRQGLVQEITAAAMTIAETPEPSECRT